MPRSAAVPTQRTEAASQGWSQLERLLLLARTHLDMELAWVSQMSETEQVIRATSGDSPTLRLRIGELSGVQESYCVRVLSGALPNYLPAARRHPVARELLGTSELGIGSYIGVPWRRDDGGVGGMVCCASTSVNPDLSEESQRFLEVVAELITDHLGGPLAEQRIRATTEAAGLAAVLAERRIRMVFQPLTWLRDRTVVGYEALARFDDPSFPTPAHAFAAAGRAGLGVELERLAVQEALAQWAAAGARRAGTAEDDVWLNVNLSVEALADPAVQELLLASAHLRLGVEITEHTQVRNYAALIAVTDRLREAGIRLAVDDAGAGYASLRHILQLRPDIIKIDLDIVRGIDTDPVRQALTRSLVTFARDIDAELVAEGIETRSERDALCALGVQLGQGYLLGRPGALPA